MRTFTWGQFLVGRLRQTNGVMGFAYANRRSVLASVNLSSTAAKLFSDGGLDLFSSIRLVDSGEFVPVDDFDFTLGQVWEGVELNTEATLANLLQGSTLSFQSVRSHEVGLSKSWGAQQEGGWELHTGVGARLILGSAYFDLQAEGDELQAFGARSEGLSWSSIQAFDSLRGTDCPWVGWTSSVQRVEVGVSTWAGFLPATTFGSGLPLWTWANDLERQGIRHSKPQPGSRTQRHRPGSVRSVTIFNRSRKLAVERVRFVESGVVVESGQEERVVRAKPMLALSAGFAPFSPWCLRRT